MERTITVIIRVDPNEEMVSVDTIEGESGCTTDFGPTPLWFDWEDDLKEQIGNEIVSWVKLMADEEE